ncbi:MAG: glutathione S-transferase [Candidatus Azotimanducaceae bacterium]|jgi:glutathione S-transferase
MLTIYAIPVSLYCAKLRILLRHKNIQWHELPPPGGYGSAEYKSIVPSGNLPALVDGSLLLADSEAIAEYLNEKYPNPPMLPTELNGRAKARELSRLHDTRLEPEVRKLFPLINSSKRNALIVDEQSQAISDGLNQLAKLLESNASNCGEVLTLGECGLAITFVWIDVLSEVFGMQIKIPQSVNQYRSRICSHSAVLVELEEYRPRLSAWFEAQGQQ